MALQAGCRCGGAGSRHSILLSQGPDVRVINAITGELLRDLTIDTTKDHQPQK